jgi:hypothetical protein
VVGSLQFTGLILLGREERIQSHWKQRATKDWDEQWDDRLDLLVTPVNPQQLPADAPEVRLTSFFQPASAGGLILLLFALGWAASYRSGKARAAAVVGVPVLVLAALSAFLDGPVPRYRYPLDPLLAVLAGGGLSLVLRRGWVSLGRLRTLPGREAAAKVSA